jgi:pimeloyl-ACP methyl ester carboxylesterase
VAHRRVAAGHNVPQEAPAEFAAAVIDVAAHIEAAR